MEKSKILKGEEIRNMEKKKTECTIKIPVDVAGLDCAIEKAKQLVDLLKEAQQIAGSLSHK